MLPENRPDARRSLSRVHHALFLDFTGTLHAWLGWMARVQFLPAVLR